MSESLTPQEVNDQKDNVATFATRLPEEAWEKLVANQTNTPTVHAVPPQEAIPPIAPEPQKGGYV